MDYKKLSIRALWCIYVASGIVDIIFLVIAYFVYNGFYSGEYFWVHIICYVVAGICILDLFIIPIIRYRQYRYCITDECIDIKEGIWFLERHVVPIERVHMVATISGPIDRMFRLAKVIVTTAGGDVVISFLDINKAEEIVNSLQKRVNIIAVEEKQKAIEE